MERLERKIQIVRNAISHHYQDSVKLTFLRQRFDRYLFRVIFSLAQSVWGALHAYFLSSEAGLILATYWVRYPDVVLFLRNRTSYFPLKPSKQNAVQGCAAFQMTYISKNQWKKFIIVSFHQTFFLPFFRYTLRMHLFSRTSPAKESRTVLVIFQFKVKFSTISKLRLPKLLSKIVDWQKNFILNLD